MRARYVALAAGMAVVTTLTPGAIAHAAPADSPADNSVTTCANPKYTVENGTISWGIKHSWRKYINGPAHGKQELQGAEGKGSSPKQADYSYVFTVDKSLSSIKSTNGKPTGANIVGTGGVHFTGHQGALDVSLQKPSFEFTGSGVTANLDYQTYFVPGKEMTKLTAEDKVPENLVKGTGKFGTGSHAGWNLEDDTLTLSTTQMKYAGDPSTNGDKVEGIDRAFLGSYDSSDAVDNATITLEVSKSCEGSSNDRDENQPVSPKPAPQNPSAPADDSTGSSSKAGIAQKVGIALGVVGIAGVIGLALAKARGLLPGSS